MKTSEAKILLQKYYNGLTTSQEEVDLEQYFQNGEVDPELETDKLHFEAMASMRDEEIPVPENLESDVLETLQKLQKGSVRINRRIVYISLSIAAGLLLMLSTFMFLSTKDRTQYINDPEIAYAESHQALELVSKYFNSGTAQLTELSKLNEAVAPLNKLNSLDKTAKSLLMLGKDSDQQ